MANRAIIGLEGWDAMQRRANAIAAAFDAGDPVTPADYHLNFADTAQLFSALTPARLALLESLQRAGSIPMTDLCKLIGRDGAAVAADLGALIDLGLIVQDHDGKICVPWAEIQMHFSLDGRAAA